MHIFDYSFLSTGLIPAISGDLMEMIGERKTFELIRRKKFVETFEALEEKAILSSVIHSNAIEGILTTDERAIAIVNYGKKPENHAEEEILGYKDALKLIHEQHDTLEISEATILRLHKMIYAYSHKSGGEYKKTNNYIHAVDGWGNSEIVYEPLSADETPQAMKNMLNAYNSAAGEGVSALLLASCLVLDFLCIHPFSDGNGRTSRLLSLLLLYKHGYDVGKFISFEEQINKRKEQYYAALAECSAVWHTNTTYDPFILDFLKTLYACYNELADRFVGVAEERTSKKERIKLFVLNSLTPVSQSEIAKQLPDISPNTIKKEILELTANGIIEKIGVGRNTKYQKK